MTTSRERVIKTLNREPVDRAPRELWTTPAVELACADELAEMTFRYPNDIVGPEFRWPRGKLAKGHPHDAGLHTDAWGCTWHAAKRGRPAEQKTHPLADPARWAAFRPPFELVENARPDAMNRACAAASQFVLARSQTRPLDRLRTLCGSELALAELTAGSQPIRQLLSALDEFSCREMEFWATTDVDGVAFRDDWGTETGLVLPRQVWRALFRPLYQKYCRILHAADKFVFFQSQGKIDEIFADLIQVGVDAIHSQLAVMDLEKLAARYRGKVTFWNGIQPEAVLRFGSPAEVRGEVDRVRRTLDFGCGGLIAQCQWDDGVPFANVAAVFQRWFEPLLAHA